MKPFAYARADDAAVTLAALDAGTRPYAGGTDLLTRMKLGITTPERLLDIKRLDVPRGIERGDDGGLRLGALTTLVDVERHDFPPAYRLLAEAAAQAATPQLRERATLGGNLLQRPRCWYYRSATIDCWLKGGDTCPAKAGRNEHHAILSGRGPERPCVAVHPSDLATCLTALDARVTLRGPDGERTLGMGDLFVEPEEGRRAEHTVRDDELLWSVDVPPVAAGPSGDGDGDGSGNGNGASVYLKAMDRKVWAFALVGVAAVAVPSEDGGRTLRLAASGVASIPWRLDGVEARLADVVPGDGAALEAAITKGLADVEPLSGNGYKVALLRRLIARAVTETAG